ncbi:hypothetical protein BDW72DRAFT_3560 [Aspergillus terricola var. indicus]
MERLRLSSIYHWQYKSSRANFQLPHVLRRRSPKRELRFWVLLCGTASRRRLRLWKLHKLILVVFSLRRDLRERGGGLVTAERVGSCFVSCFGVWARRRTAAFRRFVIVDGGSLVCTLPSCDYIAINRYESLQS